MAGSAERTLIARFTAQTKDLTSGIKTANASISSVGTTTEKTNSKLGGMAKGAGKALAGAMVAASAVAVTAVVGIGVAATKTGIKTAAAMEQSKISFTTMLGSAKEADAFLRKLSDFAAKTPFDMPGLQTAASSLVSAGINADKVIPIMTTLGDVTSGMGTGSEGIKRATVALQQMNAAGKISGEDLNQLRDAGIPVYDLLAKAMGKPKKEVAKLAQEGKLGQDALDKMMKALETGKGLERFKGLMEKQSQSMTGLWSTLQDTFQQGMGKAVEPLVPLIKDGLGTAITLVGAAMPLITQGFKALAQVAGPLLKQLGPAITEFAKGLSQVKVGDLLTLFNPLSLLFKVLMAVLPDLMGIFKQLLPIFIQFGKIISGAIIQVIKLLVPVVAQLATALGGFLVKALAAIMPMLPKLITAFLGLLPAVLAVLQAVFPLVPVLGDLLVAFSPLLDVLPQLVANLTPVIMAVAGLASTIIKQLVPVFKELMPVINLVVGILAGGMLTATKIVTGLITVIVKAFTWLFNMLVGHSIIPDLVKAITAAFVWLKNAVMVPIRAMVTAITGAFQWLWDKLSAIAAGIRDSVVAKIRQLRDWALAAFRGLRDSANSIMDTAKRWVTDKMTALRNTVGNLANSAKDKALAAFTAIRDKVGGIFGAAVANIGRVWSKLESVLKAPISFLIDTVINKGLIGAFNWVAGKVGAKGLSGLSIPGFAEGGYTGRLPSKKVAGVVHGDEQVIRSRSRRKFEAKHPGWLDYLNRTGNLPGYAAGGRVSLRGHTFTARFAAAIQNAQKLAKQVFSIFQGGFRPATSYSGTSHAGDAVDLGPISATVVRALRASGIAAWDRTGMGNWMPHIHGVPLPGFGSPSGSAVWQAQNYLKGGNGLGGADNGQGSGFRPWPIKGGAEGFFDLPSWLGKFKDVTKFLKDKVTSEFVKAGGWGDNWWAQTLSQVPQAIVAGASDGFGDLGKAVKEGFKEKFSFDSGGWLPPGVSLAVNNTGHPEPVGWNTMGAGNQPPQVIINVNGALDSDAVARQIKRLLDDHDSRRGGVMMGSRTRKLAV